MQKLANFQTVNEDVVISLGTNLGNKKSNLIFAISKIRSFSKIITQSKIFHSEPWGYQSKNTYLNVGLLIHTSYPPLELLKRLKNIENEMGRKEKTTDQYEDRIIDLDILIYNNILLNTKKLSLPHPKIGLRRFSLLILKDLYYSQSIPGLNNTADELLKRNKDYSKIDGFEEL